ncbi:hypothetical protein EVAR_50939_1 [Eumeta japonica]|uniref:Uncharacterized protein n=1 Tax=Eumeta variegata TaxID=151549 RepID=A0A4C1XEF8_EUMVA|nr:hypothetical protein EVAR_50939_1 [Eumeta japonica]
MISANGDEGQPLQRNVIYGYLTSRPPNPKKLRFRNRRDTLFEAKNGEKIISRSHKEIEHSKQTGYIPYKSGLYGAWRRERLRSGITYPGRELGMREKFQNCCN